MPVSQLNPLRRELIDRAGSGAAARQRASGSHVQATLASESSAGRRPATASRARAFRLVDQGRSRRLPRRLRRRATGPTSTKSSSTSPATTRRCSPSGWTHWAARVGRERIRLALPALTRNWEENGLRHKIDTLRAAGWTKWEAANLSAWSLPRPRPAGPGRDLDLATDWSVYVAQPPGGAAAARRWA